MDRLSACGGWELQPLDSSLSVRKWEKKKTKKKNKQKTKKKKQTPKQNKGKAAKKGSREARHRNLQSRKNSFTSILFSYQDEMQFLFITVEQETLEDV